jgi:hypothetical protein
MILFELGAPWKGDVAGWKKIYELWDKIAAWEKENLPRYTCTTHGR